MEFSFYIFFQYEIQQQYSMSTKNNQTQINRHFLALNCTYLSETW